MSIFESFAVYVVIIGVLAILLIWEQARVISLKRKLNKIEKVINKRGEISEDSVK